MFFVSDFCNSDLQVQFRQIRIYIRPGKFFFPDVKIFLKCRGSFFKLYYLYVLLMLQYFMSIFIKNFPQFIKVVSGIYAWFICRKQKRKQSKVSAGMQPVKILGILSQSPGI